MSLWKTLFAIGLGFVVTVGATAPTSPNSPASPSEEKSAKSEAAADTQDSAEAAPTKDAGKETEKGPNSCLTDVEVIRELKARRDALEAKEKALDALREELKQREALTVEELKKLEAARAELLKIEGAQKSDADQKVTKLVETLELMPPKASAKVITELEDTLAVATMSRISNLKLAKILAAMDPKRSSALSQLMAKGKKAKS